MKNKATELDGNSKNLLSGIFLVFFITVWMFLAELLANFIDGNYLRLLQSYSFSTCLLLIPVVIFHRFLRFYAWLLTPFLALVPISLFCVLLYHMPLNYDIMVVVYNTSFGEAYEFIKGYLIFFILILLGYILIYLYLAKRLPVQISFKISMWISAASFVLFFTLCTFNLKHTGIQAKVKEGVTQSYFGGLFYSVTHLYKNLQIIKHRDEAVKNFKFNALQGVVPSGRQIYVLIIDESKRLKNWQIFGYKRKTSPQLAKRGDELIKFTNTVSGGYITNIAVPLILSRGTADTYGRHYREKTAISAFKEAGFKTYWLSNQNDFGDVLMCANEADEKVTLPSDYTFGKNVTLDMELVPILKRVIEKDEQKIFIILHTLGSHYDYAARYPADYDLFKPSLKNREVNPTDYSKRQYMINSYDNTSLYSDAVIAKIIDVAEGTGAISCVTYISDHGEDLFDDDRRLSQHINAVPSHYIAHVPFFIWASAGYKSTFPNKINNLKAHQSNPIGSENLFYTLLDLGGLYYPGMELRKSVANTAFVKGTQRIMGGYGKVYNFKDLIYPRNKLGAQ